MREMPDQVGHDGGKVGFDGRKGGYDEWQDRSNETLAKQEIFLHICRNKFGKSRSTSSLQSELGYIVPSSHCVYIGVCVQRENKQKTRIHHQHLCLGEELPGLHDKDMKKKVFDQDFFERSFSVARMMPYYIKYPGHKKRAEKHYRQNIQLAETLVSSLSVFEVSLRNALIRELERMTGRKEWYLVFQTDPKLKSLSRYINTATDHIKARGEVITADKINGELTLGFWVSLFNAEYERHLWKVLRNSFPNLPKARKKRKNVSAPLNTIRLLRNRVFHHESISWNLPRLRELHDLISTVTGWIDQNLPIWIKQIDRFNRTFGSILIERWLW